MKQADEIAATAAFPDCNLYHMEQRSEEWYDIRKGRLTASASGMWLADQPRIDLTVPQLKDELKSAGIDFTGKTKRDDLIALLPNPAIFLAETKATVDARDNAVNTALGELVGGVTPSDFFVDPDGPPPSNPAKFAVWNGIRLEADALEWFQDSTGKKVTQVGFAKSKHGDYGCSPDGLLIAENEGLEIKCPQPKTHIRYIRQGVTPEEYLAQIHFSLAVTGADRWHFLSYTEAGVSNLHTVVERDETTERFKQGLEKYNNLFQSVKAQLAKDWEAQHQTEENA